MSRGQRIGRWIETRVVNALMRTLVLRAGLMRGTYAVLETTGRRTGRVRRTPVANGQVGDTFWLISGQGRRAHYMHNLQANPRVRVRVRSGWRGGTAHVLPDDDAWARHRELGRGRLGYRLDGLILRAFATEPTTVRIDLDP